MPDFDAFMKKRRAHRDFDAFMQQRKQPPAPTPAAQPTPTPAPAPSTFQPGITGFAKPVVENMITGAQRLGATVGENALAIADFVRGTSRGDVRPATEIGERAIRTVATLLGEGARGGEIGEELRRPTGLVEAQQRSETRRLTESPYAEGFQGVQELRRRADVRAARDPSLPGKIIRRGTEFAGLAAPAVATGIATGGSLPTLATLATLQSVGQPENLPLNVAGEVAPVPVGQAFKAGINTIRRQFGKGAAQVIEAEVTPAATAQLRQAIPEVPPATSLPSVFTKLETDNVEQIGAMIANANRRYASAKNITPEERLSAWDDYNRLKDLTPDEQRALSQVLPARTYSPVTAAEDYSRNISDIPSGQPDPQLDANLRELEQFFGGQSTAPRLAAETGPPALSADMSISAASPSVRAASASVTGPRVGADLDALNATVSQAAESVPKPVARRVLDELAAIYHLPRTLLSSLDLSAPFRQGALLTVPPTQWGRAGRAAVRMFQSLKTKNYEQIADAIATHADAPVADDAGLYLATKAQQGLGGREEAFLSKYAGRIPLVKQSQQAYQAYLDSLRMDTFAKYKRVIDGQGLAPEQAQAAYKAAATWINYATGRGSLGQTIDRAMPAFATVIFSPRYVASRLNVLNPAYYARNAATPAGRAVLKQQMGELVQYAGMVAGTMALAKAAGADVGLNPNSPDFLKIRAGNWRYDTLAGLQQVMRLIYRAGGDIKNKLQGEQTKGPNALDVSGRFLRSKLAPAPGAFVDFITGRTVTGKTFNAGESAVKLVAPIQWADFVEAYQKEGFGGVAASSPGFFGFGVQNYERTPVDAAIEKSRPLFTELQRLDKRVSELRRKDGEKDDAFNARVQQFSGNYTRFGQELISSPRFQAAPDALKAIALDRLNERAKQITHKEFAFPEIELDPEIIMDAAESSKKNPANQ